MAETGQSIHIIFLIRSLGNGGAERQLATLAIGLHGLGHNIEVVTFYPGGIYKDKLSAAGVKVTSLDKRGRWDVIGFYWRLVKLVRTRRPQVLHSYMTGANIFAVLIKPLVKSITVIWGVRASYVDAKQYNWAVGFMLRIERLLSRFVHLIITNSQAGRLFTAGLGFPADKIVVISNGIDTEQFRPDDKGRERFRTQLSIGRPEKLVGLIGRIDPIKGHSAFIEAAAILHRKHPDIRFVCVGTGPENYRLALMKQAKAFGLNNALIWAGQFDDMKMVYSGIDLMCLVSSGEGFPNVVAEAMACGTPCVVTDVGDAAAIVGELGRVVPVAAPQQLAEAIQLSLASPADRQILRSKIVNNFSVDRLYFETIKAFHRLLKNQEMMS